MDSHFELGIHQVRVRGGDDMRAAQRFSCVERLERRTLLAFSPVGGEFQVNTFTTSEQRTPAVAMDGDGDFVATWVSLNQDGSGLGIFAQRYNSAGVAQGSEFRVNTHTTNSQRNPKIAMDTDGDFVIVWDTLGQAAPNYDVYAKRYNALGVPQGEEFRVNTHTTNQQLAPAVAMDAAGNFVVAWQSREQDGDGEGIYAQHFNFTGVPQGSEFKVNTFTTGDQTNAAVAMGGDGRFAVSWVSAGQDGSGAGVYAQAYDASGAPVGGEMRVNTFTTGNQQRPTVAIDATGSFVIAWTSFEQDGAFDGVYAQRFNAAGVPQGDEFRVNVRTADVESFPSVAMRPNGEFMIAFTSPGFGDVNSPIVARRYDATGASLDSGFLVSTITTVSRSRPAVSMDHRGNAIVVWEDFGQDGSSLGIFGQRFHESVDTAGPVTAGIFVNGKRVTPYSSHAEPVQQVVVSFSEALSTSGGATGANSVTNPSNWLLTRDGIDISGTINIAFGLNASTNRFEATLAFSNPQTSGNFNLMPRDTIHDLSGNALDGNFNGTPGGNVPLPFSVASFGARGDESRVNTFTTNSQSRPSAAMDAEGNYVVAWSSFDQDGSGSGIYAQRYDVNGVPRGGEFRVNTFTTHDQRFASVGMDADGDFVVAWMSFTQDGSGNGIYAQRYNAAGAAQGSEFRVNTFTAGDQSTPRVGMGAQGDFVITWTSASQDGSGIGVYAQRYRAGGGTNGGEFRVNVFTTGNQWFPSAAMDQAGNFVIAWEGDGQDGSGAGIFARRYNVAGVAQGGEFQVNTFTTSGQFEPAIAMDANGNFVIAWESTAQDGSFSGVYAQRFNAAGVMQGDEFRANTFTTNFQFGAAAAMDDDGDFVITWSSYEQDGVGFGVYGQRYDKAGLPQGNEFRANTFTSGEQFFPAVAMSADLDFVIAWESGPQDGSGSGIYTQRYNVNRTPTVGLLTDTPDPVISGNQLTLSATNLADDAGISSVSFYRETNGLPGLQAGAFGDTLVAMSNTPTNGTFAANVFTSGLSDGTYTYWAQATDSGGLTGLPASTTNTIIGAAPPSVNTSEFLFETLPQRLRFTFSTDVSASLALEDAIVQTLPGGANVPLDGFQYDHATNTATFGFDFVIPDSHFRVTLPASGIAGPTGLPMSADHTFDFFFLRADGNRDGVVNLADFNRIAANFGQSPRTFSQGDYNYDGIVNLQDFNQLAGRFGMVLGNPALSSSPFGSERITDSTPDDSLTELLK